jgi:hypothetical protein
MSSTIEAISLLKRSILFLNKSAQVILIIYRHLQSWTTEPDVVINLLWPLDGRDIAEILLKAIYK